MIWTFRWAIVLAAVLFLACEGRAKITSRLVEAASPYPRRVEIPQLPPSLGRGALQINAYFADRLETEYTCHAAGVAASDLKEMSYAFKATVTSIRGPLLGVTTEFDWYCGGPHPVSGTSALFFDLRTGSPIDFRSLVKKGRKAELVRKYLERAGPVHAECAPLLTPPSLEATDFEFLPGEAGARVFPLLPYAMRACANLATFGWSELEVLMTLTS